MWVFLFFFKLWSSYFLMFKIRSFQFRDDIYFLAHLMLVFQSFHPIGSPKIIRRTRFCMSKEQIWLQSMDVTLLSRHKLGSSTKGMMCFRSQVPENFRSPNVPFRKCYLQHYRTNYSFYPQELILHECYS